MAAQHLGHLRTHCIGWVQAGHGFLENHRHAITAQARHLCLIVIANIITGEGKPRSVTLAALGEQPHHRK